MTAKQLKKWREAMGITQKQAAELLGVHIETIKSYEIGRRPISKPVAKLCNMLSESAKKSQKQDSYLRSRKFYRAVSLQSGAS